LIEARPRRISDCMVEIRAALGAENACHWH
jgi:hypothetical protein